MTLIFNNPVLRYCKNSFNRYGITFEYDVVDQVHVRDLDDNDITDWVIEGTDLRFTTSTPPEEFEIYRFTDLSTFSYGTAQFSQFSSGSSISSAELNNNLEIFRTIVEDWRSSGSSSVDVSNTYGLAEFVINQPSVNITAYNLNSTFELFRQAVLYINDLQSGLDPSFDVDISRSYGESTYSVFSQSTPITAEKLNGNFEFIRAAIEETVGTLLDSNPEISKTSLLVNFNNNNAGLTSGVYQEAVELLLQYLPPYWNTDPIPGATYMQQYRYTLFGQKCFIDVNAIGYATLDVAPFEFAMATILQNSAYFDGVYYPYQQQVAMVFQSVCTSYTGAFSTPADPVTYDYDNIMDGPVVEYQALFAGTSTNLTPPSPPFVANSIDYNFGPGYHQGVVFQVNDPREGIDPTNDIWLSFRRLLQYAESGTIPPYTGNYSVAGYGNCEFVYNVPETGSAQYYANLVISKYNEKTGFNIPLIT
tara:strand:+ start:2386 stop:3813 length:1428 start_codon:yes stop_codon:yes gene_type:complete